MTDRDADFAAVATAHDHFGRLDIVVNNAGYGQFGFIEELSESEARDQIETNVFGALWITQAALPFLRAQRSGHIIQVSSIGGITAFQNVGIYHASKWALEGLSQALRPGGRAVRRPRNADRAGRLLDRLGRRHRPEHADPLPTTPRRTKRRTDPRRAQSPSRRSAGVGGGGVLKVVDAENPPLRVFFGELPIQLAKADYENRLKTWEEWQPVAVEAQG